MNEFSLLTIAYAAHSGQVDKAGQPFFEHVLAVGMAVLHHGLAYFAAGLLHDIIEDTDHTAESLRALGLPGEVVDAVVALTHLPGEPRADYYARVRENPIALVVKRADVYHNAAETRLSLLPPATANRLRRKYAEALVALESVDAE